MRKYTRQSPRMTNPAPSAIRFGLVPAISTVTKSMAVAKVLLAAWKTMAGKMLPVFSVMYPR